MTNPLPFPRPRPARPPLPAGLLAGVLAGAASIQAVGVLWAQDLAFTLSAVAGFAALAALAAVGSARHHPHPRFGAANQITLARGTATALLAGLVAAPDVLGVSVVHAWLPFAAASALLILDLCDGALARRQGLASNFGARFDREVDAAAILVLSALAVVLAGAPAWTLGIGALRYLYLGAGWLVPALTRPLPYSLRRRAVCGVQIAALGILLAPPLPEAWIAAIAGAALAALALSFLRDLLWCLARPLGVTPRPARGVRA
jgi:phosphatidylglycerophosphate synthase